MKMKMKKKRQAKKQIKGVSLERTKVPAKSDQRKTWTIDSRRNDLISFVCTEKEGLRKVIVSRFFWAITKSDAVIVHAESLPGITNENCHQKETTSSSRINNNTLKVVVWVANICVLTTLQLMK